MSFAFQSYVDRTIVIFQKISCILHIMYLRTIRLKILYNFTYKHNFRCNFVPNDIQAL